MFLIVQSVVLVSFFLLQSASSFQLDQQCDIVVAGGSTAALATAITAAKAAPQMSVCLLEVCLDHSASLLY